MQNLFVDTRKLDEAVRASYGLTEEIMMENAAVALSRAVREFDDWKQRKKRVLILCGGGNNGADGYALARHIRIDFDVVIFQCVPPKSHLCITQCSRAEKCGSRIFDIEDFRLEFLEDAGIVVDCIFGSGFHGNLDKNIQCLLNDVNDVDTYRIACDVPSGLRSDGTVADGCYKAHKTVTMGALKLSMFSDEAKDLVGEIFCANLGVERRLFENSTNGNLKVGYLLDKTDMILPFRKRNCVNKGSFGHVAVAFGEKSGAALIAGSAALRFGAGLVTLVDLTDEKPDFSRVPPELICATSVPKNVTAFAFGMGLGRTDHQIEPYFKYLQENPEVACVIDADVCYSPLLPEFLQKRQKRVVLTPHPKEFAALLKNCGFGEFTTSECIEKKTELIEKFCRKYPKCVLLVKGANTMIGYYNNAGYGRYDFYVNPFGGPALAKAGSGDVLSGLICALLAQDYSAIDAAVSASIAHALAGISTGNNYAMTPLDLIQRLTELKAE